MPQQGVVIQLHLSATKPSAERSQLLLRHCNATITIFHRCRPPREPRRLVLLKLGEQEIALREYDAALLTDRNRTLALYGRGLVRVAKDDVKNGEKDKDAARARMPSADCQFASYGIE